METHRHLDTVAHHRVRYLQRFRSGMGGQMTTESAQGAAVVANGSFEPMSGSSSSRTCWQGEGLSAP